MTARTRGLAAHAAARSDASVERIENAIAALQQRGAPVTTRAITATANKADPRLPTLCESVIYRNERAYAAYLAARPDQPRPPRKPRMRDPGLERRTKAELIDMVHDLRGELRRCLARIKNMAFRDARDDQPPQ
jgi:hypothetical protein